MLSISKRPKSFNDFIGQKTIIKEMKKRSLKKDFPEVMIFEGESGTGKTSLAFIIASLINDLNPLEEKDCLAPNPESPCFKSVFEERFDRDVQFYDASAMGKQAVVDITDYLSVSPMFDKNKVVIIDEAQELSKAGKGATLKLLEKKRKNSYIILCTMNIGSLDKAIQSRGQVYKFKKIDSSDISQYLFSLVEQEKLEVPDEFITEGLFTISESCDGSLRQALQTFERCVNSDIYTSAEITAEFGLLSQKRLNELLELFVKKDPSFLKEIQNESEEDFLYKGWSVLSDALIFSMTKEIEPVWKKKYLITLCQNENNLMDVYKLLSNIIMETGNYFKKPLFYGKLVEYFKQPEVKKLQEIPAVPIRKPVGRKPV